MHALLRHMPVGEIVIQNENRFGALRLHILPDDKIGDAVADKLQIGRGDVVHNHVDFSLLSALPERPCNTVPSDGGDIDAGQLVVRFNRAGGDPLGQAVVEETAFRLEDFQLRIMLGHLGEKAGEPLAVRVMSAPLSDDRKDVSVLPRDECHQCSGRPSGGDVVRTDIGDAVGVADVGVQRHDRNAVFFGQLIDFLPNLRVCQRHQRETVDAFKLDQLVDQRKLMLDVRPLHRPQDNFNGKHLRIGQMLQLGGERPDKAGAAGVQDNADFPFFRLSRHEPCGDISHFPCFVTDLCGDGRTNAGLVVQGAVYRTAGYAAGIGDLLHGYHGITTPFLYHTTQGTI